MHDDSDRPVESEAAEEFAYFMIRVRRAVGKLAGDGGPITGVVERLGSGEKRTFDAGPQLLAFIEELLRARTEVEDRSIRTAR